MKQDQKLNSWKEKRDYLCKLIKKVSDEHGGDDIEWLREYAKDVIKKYSNDLDVAIVAFESLRIDKDVTCVAITEPYEDSSQLKGTIKLMPPFMVYKPTS
jgi:hypothetical protein